MIEITFSTMVELLGMEVEKEVNVDFNEVFQRMTLDAIGRETFDFNVLLSFAKTLIVCDTFTINVIFTFYGIFQGMTLDAIGPFT